MGAKNGFVTLGLLFALACLLTLNTPGEFQQTPGVLSAQESSEKSLSVSDDRHISGEEVPSWAKGKQRKALLHANLDKSRKDAIELATLAQELREELNRENGKTLSPDCMIRLNRIEKLAKKIREELRAY
jgi:hypothetical protein